MHVHEDMCWCIKSLDKCQQIVYACFGIYSLISIVFRVIIRTGKPISGATNVLLAGSLNQFAILCFILRYPFYSCCLLILCVVLWCSSIEMLCVILRCPSIAILSFVLKFPSILAVSRFFVLHWGIHLILLFLEILHRWCESRVMWQWLRASCDTDCSCNMTLIARVMWNWLCVSGHTRHTRHWLCVSSDTRHSLCVSSHTRHTRQALCVSSHSRHTWQALCVSSQTHLAWCEMSLTWHI